MKNNVADKYGINSDVKIYDLQGNLLQHKKNIVALGGRIALENIFKRSTTVGAYHKTIATMLTTQKAQEYTNSGDFQILDMDSTNPSIEEYFNRSIKYFCIGNGGIENDTTVQMAKPKPHETRLYNFVPFRCVKNELPTEEASRYAMKCKENIDGGPDGFYFTYYFKKFEDSTNNDIKVVKSDGTPYVPEYSDSDFNNVGMRNEYIHSFYEISLTIDAMDFKEWYKAKHDSQLNGAFTTEFGLVIGNHEGNTVKNAELFSKLVHSPINLNLENNGAMIVYTVYS